MEKLIKIEANMAETKTSPQFHSREERVKLFGLDMAAELVWKGGQWAAGGEFKKKLHIKNVSTKVLHIRYKLPATKFFSMDFPKRITLSPGVAINLVSQSKGVSFMMLV